MIKSGIVKVGRFEEVLNELKDVGACQDHDINLVKTALLLSLLNHPGKSINQYETHLDALIQAVKLTYEEFTKEGSADNSQYLSLKHIISDRFHYSGVNINDDIFAADMMNVIDQRQGVDFAIGIIYLHIGRSLGWDIEGIYIPDRFLLKLSEDSKAIIFDPCNECKVLQTHDLRKIIKNARGDHAELSASYYLPLSNREIIIRMHNLLKLKFIEDESYQEALDLVEHMQMVAPQEFRLFLDQGVLSSRLNKPQEAIKALENYVSFSDNHQDKMEAAFLIQEIRERYELINSCD